MNKDDIMAGIERLGPWFHKIDLGHGLTTKTRATVGEDEDHPLPTWRKISACWPQSFAGQTVLDVGCNAGFYAVEAKRRGAARVLGVDSQRHHVTQANFVRRALGLDIEFRRLSVYDLSLESVGQFDVTLALGLLYHCKHLVLAAERLAHVTKETLIIETAVYPTEKQPASFQHPIAGPERDIHPIGYIENPPDAKEAVYNWFLPSVESLKAIFSNLGFAQISVIDVEYARAILVCRKKPGYADTSQLGPLESKLVLTEGPTQAAPEEILEFYVQAGNTGNARWLAGEGAGKVGLGAHLLDEEGETLNWDYGRAYLECDLLPGASVDFRLMLKAPSAPGRYWLEFDLVAEGVTWFEDAGSVPLRVALEVVNC